MIEFDIASGTRSEHAPDGRGTPAGLTSEFFAVFRRAGALTPERRLMLAVLENAVTCYRRYAHSRDVEARRWFDEAREWLLSPDRSEVFSFESICDALDLHPDYVRRNLRPPDSDRHRVASGRAEQRTSRHGARGASRRAA